MSRSTSKPPRALALLGLLAACAARQPADTGSVPGITGATLSRPAGFHLALERSDGMPIDVADHLGQAVLLIAFTMDNISSQAMLREAERVAAAHPEDLAVIGIAGENLPPGPHLEMLRVFRQVVGLQRVELARPDLEVREGTSALGVIERVPVAYLVNRAGRLSRRVDGLQSRQQLEELVAPALPSR